MPDKLHISEKDIRTKLGELESDKLIPFLQEEFEREEVYDLMTHNHFGRILGEEIRNNADFLIESENLDAGFAFLEQMGNRYHGREVSGNNLGSDLFLYAADIAVKNKKLKRAEQFYEFAGDIEKADGIRAILSTAHEVAKRVKEEEKPAEPSAIEKAINRKGGNIPVIDLDKQ